MEEAVFVHVGKAQHGLVHDRLDFLLGEGLFTVFHKLVDVLLHVLENEVEIVINANDFLELHNLAVIELAERLDFS